MTIIYTSISSSIFFFLRLFPFQGLPQRIITNRFCDSHDDLALGFTPDALPDATLTTYPGLGPALFTLNLCSLVAGFYLLFNTIQFYL